MSGLDVPFNTEIYCPDMSYRFLVLQTTKEQVHQSIIDAINYREMGSLNVRYTVLRFPGQSSTSIYNVTPQELLSQCQLIERPRKLKDIDF